MKRVLSCICIFVLLLSGTAYALDSVTISAEVAKIAASLETAENVEELLGEAVILMIENDVLTKLNEKGETASALDLKSSADAALDASANDSEDARDKAITFCNKLQEAISVLSTYESHIGFVEAVDSAEFTTDNAAAAYARCSYVQTTDNLVSKFIAAKYSKTTGKLITANLIDVGAELKASEKKNYHIPLEKEENAYYRIFLFDGTTLKPVLNSQRIG